MRKYWHCLRQPYALRLLAVNFLGRLPNGMGALATVLFLRANDVSYGRVGAVAAVYGVCTAIGSPVLGRIVDRRGQSTTLLVGAVGSGAGFALLAWLGGSSFPAALAGVAVAGFFMPPLEPALRSMWPSVLPDASTVEVAYALDTALQNILFVAGPLVVVLLVGATSTTTTLLVIGVLGVLGTLLYTANPPVRRWRGEQRPRHWAGALRSPLLVVLLAGMLFVGAVVGVFNVATVAYAERTGAPGFSGVLLGAFSVGSLVGGLAYGARSWSGEPLRRLLWLLVAMAACTWPLVVVADRPTMVVLITFAGLGLAPVLTCTFVLIGKVARRGTVTEAFAWVTAVFLGGSAAGSGAAGAVLPHLGLAPTFAVAGIAATLAFLVVLSAPSFARSDSEAGADLR
ncbi:MFS transporter [Actinokineospora sp. NBRC 105648]|nr:MFS transporter [Actinokineospora sp. NBRC 105648]